MFEYSICNQYDKAIFKKQCQALEAYIDSLIRDELTVDVDGSQMQEYQYKGNLIKVINSYQENEVFVQSEIELEQFFY